MRKKCETGGHISSLIRIREMGPNRVQVWVNNAHGHRRNKPKKGSKDKESGTKQSNSLGSAFVFNAEVSLGHCRRVVAKRDHHRPAGKIDPSKLAVNRNRLHLLGQRVG